MRGTAAHEGGEHKQNKWKKKAYLLYCCSSNRKELKEGITEDLGSRTGSARRRRGEISRRNECCQTAGGQSGICRAVCYIYLPPVSSAAVVTRHPGSFSRTPYMLASPEIPPPPPRPHSFSVVVCDGFLLASLSCLLLLFLVAEAHQTSLSPSLPTSACTTALHYCCSSAAFVHR